MKPVPLVRLAALVSLAFSLSFTSGVLEPAVLGHKILELAGDTRNTVLGFITSSGLLVAVITQPLIGIVSDRTTTRWGRRVPFMLVGTLIVTAAMYLIAFAPVIAVLAIGYLTFSGGSNTMQAPWQTVFREHVPAEQRGLASAVRSIFEVIGSLTGRLVAGQIVSLAPAHGRAMIVLAVSAPVVAAIIVVSIVAIAMRSAERNASPIHVTDSQPSPRESSEPDATQRDGLQPGFGWVLLNRFLFWIGFIGVTTFLLFFVIDVLDYAEAAAQRLIGQLSALIGIVLLASLVPVGRLADRIGRRPLIVAAGALAALGTGTVVVARDPRIIAVSAGVIGLGIGMHLSASWALVTDVVPSRSAARYLGIANTAGASGSAVARLAGGALIDAINHATGSHVTGYRTMYALAAATFALSALVGIKLPTTRAVGPSAAPTTG